MELVINRKRWGNGDEGGSLLGENNKMCCLGFFCRQAGFKPSKIRQVDFPSDVACLDADDRPKDKKTESIMCLLTEDGRSNAIAKNLAAVNDSTSWRYDTLPKKEKRIKELFKKVGVSVKFVN